MAKGSKKDAIRVLYVEDNEHDTRAVFRALEKSGRSFEITHSTRAEEAIKRLEREPSAHDILLTDYMLPGMSGLELCKTLVGEGLSIPIVILTGTGTEAVAVEALKSGAFDYVVKDPSRGYIKLLPVVLGEVVAKHADKQARAKAEAALRASEERFRRIFEESPMGVVMSELDGKIVAANGQLSKITGYSQEELLEMHSSDLTHPDDIELSKAYFKKIAQTGLSPGRIEKRYISKSGEVVWAAVTGGLLDAENGGQQYAFGMIEDISDRKAAKEALRASEANLENAQRIAKLGHWIWDLESGEVNWSDEHYRLFGVEKSQFTPTFRNVMGLIHPDDSAEVERLLLSVEEKRQGVTFEYRVKLPDGRDKTLRAHCEVVLDQTGELREVSGIVQDITAQKAAEEEILRQKAKSEKYLEVAAHMMLALDSEGCVTLLNRAGSVLVECDSKEVIGLNWFANFVPEDQRELVWGEFRRLMAGETEPLDEFENEVLTAKGNRKLTRWLNTALRDDDGKIIGTLSSCEDITELKEVEEKLRQAQKMEAVGQLTGGVAHEFNNLLMVVLGSLELIQDRVSEDEEALELLASALRGARRGASLTQSLLAFSRKQQLEVGEVDLNRLVLSMTDFLKRTLGATIALEAKLADDLWRPAADAGQIEAAILNFAINARDAMPDGGNITVRTENQKVDSSLAAVHDVEKGDYVSLEVTDTGLGMEDDVLKHALEPFFTTKDVDKGTGLGLSVVYGFVRQSGGFMEITSKVGKGTTVRLCLPRYREADQKRKSADASE